MQKIKKIHEVDSQKNVSDKQIDKQTERLTDEQMNRSDFIGPFLQRWRFDHIFLEI